MPRPLIARRLELDRLIELAKQAKAGGATAVLLRGDAGIGKSRLLSEFQEHARLLGMRVLAGRADALARSVPYASLQDALRGTLADEISPGLAHSVRELQNVLRVGQPGLGSEAPAESDTYSAAQVALERVLKGWSARQALVLAIDDLHDADHDTLALLSSALRHLGGTRCLFVAATRPGPPDLSAELQLLIERLSAEGVLSILDLAPLDREEVRALSASMLDASPDDHLAETVWDASGGNPFYVVQGLANLRERGSLVYQDGRVWLAGNGSPLTLGIKQTLMDRLDRLPGRAAEVARVLTLFPRFSLERLPLVAQLAGVEVPDAEVAFDGLVGAGVLRQVENGFEFSHPIARDTLYVELGPAQRRRLHRTIADALALERELGRPINVLELATHLSECAGACDDDAVKLLAEAGDLTSRTAPRASSRWYARAAELAAPGSALQAHLLARLTRSQYLSGQVKQAVESGEAALAALPEGPEWARTAAFLVAGLSMLGRPREGVELATRLLDSQHMPAPVLLARRSFLNGYIGDLEAAADDAAEALRLAGEDQSARLFAVAARAATAFTRGRFQESLEYLDGLIEIAQQLPPASRLVAHGTRAVYAALMGEPLTAAASLQEGRGLAAELGGSAFRAELDLAEVHLKWLQGRWDEALELARWAVVEHQRTGELLYIALFLAAEAGILVERAQHARARAVLAQLPDPALGGNLMAVGAAGVEAALGNVDAARHLLEEALADDQRAGRHDAAHRLWSNLALLEHAAGSVEAAATHLRALQGHVVKMGTPLPRVLALLTEARVTGSPEAARSALAVARESGLRFEEGRALYELAALGAEPAVHLRQADEIFSALQALPWQRRSAALLKSLALPRGRRERRGRSQLSETELQIAQLVHEGRRNREIAELMYLSPKTVEIYLSRIYRKTGHRGRLELALAVAEGRLGPEGAAPPGLAPG